MEKMNLLAKARLCSAYTASEIFFSDLETVKHELTAADVLEIYDLWQYWHLRLRGVHLYGLKQISRSQDELERKQVLSQQFYFLDSEFLPKLTDVVEIFQDDLVEYGQNLLQHPDNHLREIVELQGMFRLLSNHRIEKTEATTAFVSTLNGYITELIKNINF